VRACMHACMRVCVSHTHARALTFLCHLDSWPPNLATIITRITVLSRACRRQSPRRVRQPAARASGGGGTGTAETACQGRAAAVRARPRLRAQDVRRTCGGGLGLAAYHCGVGPGAAFARGGGSGCADTSAPPASIRARLSCIRSRLFPGARCLGFGGAW
jgi:hypothetical protein